LIEVQKLEAAGNDPMTSKRAKLQRNSKKQLLKSDPEWGCSASKTRLANEWQRAFGGRIENLKIGSSLVLGG